jgi:hypothetical protein
MKISALSAFAPRRSLCIVAFGFLAAGAAWGQMPSSTPFPAPKVSPTTKKGIGLPANSSGYADKLAALKVTWTYSWGANIPHSMPAGVEFVPMVWGLRHSETQDSFYKRLATEAEAGKFNTLLGFNEPDGADQANLPVADALAAWPKLMSVGVRLGSPAGVHPDVPWMTDFMRAAKKDKLRVDFITVHWYGGAADGGAFISYLSKIHALYNKPIWITEFCPADWNAGPNRKNKNTPQQVAQFMKAVVPVLKRTPWIERFAWFSSDPASPRLGCSTLFNADGSLTDLGKIYAEF